MYYGDFDCREDVEHQFEVTLDKNVKIIYANYHTGDYCGDAVVLFKQGRKLYEVRGSHCSCYGLEGQWDPDEVSKDQLTHMFEKGSYYEHCKDEIKKALGWK